MSFYISFDGTKIFYRTCGTGQTLIFFHGWGTSGDVWKKQIDVFRKNFQCIVVDLRGHGKSEWSSSVNETTLGPALQRDISGFFEYLDIEGAIWIGWSLGAMLGLKFLSKQTRHITACVLVSGNAKFVTDPDYACGLSPKAARRIRKHLDMHPLKTIQSCFQSYYSQKEQKRTTDFWKDLAWPDFHAAKTYFDMLCRFDGRDELGKITIPTLICHGTDDQVHVPDAAMYMKKGIENARCEYFEGAGHILFLTETERFNGILGRFVNILKNQKRLEREMDKITKEL